MGTEQQLGTLVIIGGAEDREGDCAVLREFVRLHSRYLLGLGHPPAPGRP